jgi:methylglutaconyl-CoA hydratase
MNHGANRVLVSVSDGVATLTLNRPDKRNALDAETVRTLHESILAMDRTGDVRVMVLRGAGPDFCAGADLEQLERIAAGADPLENIADATALGDLFIAMRRAAKPIIAAVHGHAIAGGAGLATAADLIVASESATFGYPEVKLGFVPAMVTALLRRSVGEKIAFEMITLGTTLSAPDGARLGLVARVFPDDHFGPESETFVREMAARSSSAIQLCKRLLYGIDGASFESAIAHGAEVNAIARATPDCREGVRRFLEKRSR